MAFEIVDMGLDERSKYRRLLADNHTHRSTPVTEPKLQSQSSPAEPAA
jgi:hypothetical protein